jgi:cell wall assembly regulator SMI1
MNKIKKVYKSQFDKPYKVIKYSNVAGSREAIECFVTFPVPNDDIFETLIATIGLSAKLIRGEYKYAELVIRVKGKLDSNQLEEISNSLYKFHKKLITSKAKIYSGMIIREGKISMFAENDITSAMLVGWDPFEPTWLDEPENKIVLLEIVPLFVKEGESLAEIPVFDRFKIFWNSKTPYKDCNRKQVEIIEIAIKNIWLNIKEWFHERIVKSAANVGLQYKKEVASVLQKKMSVKFPPDFYVSVNLNSASFDINEYTLLNAEDIIETWKINELEDEGKFKLANKKVEKNRYFKKVWWNSKWIPFAKNSYGDKICIDLDPGPSGQFGQVLYHYNDQGPIFSEFKSFFQWLLSYNSDLQNSKYKVVDGFIEYT